MALNGQLITNKYSNTARCYKLVWSAEQDIAANSSTISYTLTAEGQGWWAERTLEVVLGGITIISKTDRVERWDGVIKSGTIELAHNNDGTKSFDVSIRAAVYGSSVNCNANDTFTLDAIPRGAKITYISKFTDETNPVITYSNPAANNVSSIKITMVEKAGTDLSIKKFAERTDISKTGTTYTFALTEAERESIRNFYTTTNNPSVCFNITVVNGGATFNYSYTKKMEIVNVEPQLSPVVVDGGSVSTTLTGNPNTMIKYFNSMEYAVNAVAKKGATITAIKAICGNETQFTNSGYFANAASNVFTFKVMDSRGNPVEQEITVPMVNYIPLTCAVDGEIELDTADGTKANITITISGNYFKGSFGAQENALTLSYIVTANDGETFTEYLTLTNSNYTTGGYKITYTIPYKFDYKKSYVVGVNATDKINDLAVSSKTLKAIPIFDWGEDDFNFNVPIKYNNAVIDFPVEQGNNNGWSYRKWASGKAECWKTITHNTAIQTAWGSLYSGTATSRQTYPFLFIEKPVEQATLTAGKYQALLFPEKDGNGVNGAAASACYNLCRPSATASAEYYINLYVCGKW